MRSCYAEADPYTYPGVSVLRNKLGITDQQILDKQERIRSAIRLFKSEGPPQTFDYTHFRALHFHMFQDLYDWAGLERTVTITKDGSLFAYPGHLRENGIAIMRGLREGVQNERHSIAGLLHALGHFATEMNALHPFREGNGRTLR